jgi:hypothetical protein
VWERGRVRRVVGRGRSSSKGKSEECGEHISEVFYRVHHI